MRLSAFKYVPRHIRGSDNVIADALSRMFEPADEPNKPVIAPLVVNFPLAFADLSSHQAQDPQLSQIISKLEAGTPVGNILLNRESCTVSRPLASSPRLRCLRCLCL